MKIINVSTTLLACIVLTACTNDILEKKYKKRKKFKTANEFIKQANASEFIGWEHIPVYIISETISNNKFLTFGNSNQVLFFAPQHNGNDQKFYIKTYGTFVEIYGYPSLSNQKYGLQVLGTGNNYAGFKLFPRTTAITKWKLWNVLNDSSQQFLFEALSPAGIRNNSSLPVQSVLTVNNLNYNDKNVYFSLFHKNSFQRYRIIPAEEFELVDIKYAIKGNALKLPDFISTAAVSNNSSVEQHSKMIFTKKAAESSSWKVNSVIASSIRFESPVRIPLFVNGKFTYSETASASAEYGKNSIKEDNRPYEFSVKIPPRSTVQGKVTVKQYTQKISYMVRVKGKTSGKIIKIKGIWKGISSGEISYKIDEIKSGNGTVQKL